MSALTGLQTAGPAGMVVGALSELGAPQGPSTAGATGTGGPDPTTGNMPGTPPKPKPAVAPKPPAAADPAVAAADEDQRKNRLRGRASTILTSGMGLMAPAPVATRTLMGS